jgi:two-component system, NtrC family, response regulator AtoC
MGIRVLCRVVKELAMLPRPTSAEEADASAAPAPRRVLIVEDDDGSRQAISEMSRRSGYATDVAAYLADGLTLLSRRPDVVVVNLVLPDGSGAELLRRVRSRSLPMRVAVVTGVSDPVALNELRSLRPDAVFLKPMELQDLRRWLEEAHGQDPGR